MEIFFLIFRYLGQGVLWLFMIGVSFVMIKNVIKSVNKVRKDEDTKWADVVGDIVGNAVVVVIVIAFGLWVNTFLEA